MTTDLSGWAPGGGQMLGRNLLGQADLGWLEATFVRLFDGGPVGPLAGLGLLLASAGIGAAHALAPGHGKALLAGYLVGERGRTRDAVTFGVLVAVLHTLSVAVVAVALLLLGRTAAVRGDLPPALALGPWLTLVSGLVVTGVGLALLVRHLRGRRPGRQAARDRHHHEHGDAHEHGRERGGDHGREHDHEHDHGHGHDDEHGHLHALPPDVSPLSRRGLVLLGASGGLLPSPSAFLVLSTGLFTGRAAFALLLVAAFSVGLAATITAIGIAVVKGRDRALARMERGGGRFRRLLAAVPLLSAGLILAVGVVLVVRAAFELA